MHTSVPLAISSTTQPSLPLYAQPFPYNHTVTPPQSQDTLNQAAAKPYTDSSSSASQALGSLAGADHTRVFPTWQKHITLYGDGEDHHTLALPLHMEDRATSRVAALRYVLPLGLAWRTRAQPRGWRDP